MCLSSKPPGWAPVFTPENTVTKGQTQFLLAQHVVSIEGVGKIPRKRKWQPTPVFLPGESQGRGSLVGCCLWGRTESDMTEAT